MSEQVNENVASFIGDMVTQAYGGPERLAEIQAQEVQDGIADPETAADAQTQPDTQAEATDAQEAAQELGEYPPEYATVLDEDLEIELALDEPEIVDEDDDEDEYLDPRLAAERERRRELERELERTRRQSARAESDRWRAEADRVFPLLPEHVRDRLIAESKSHRGFLKAAKAQHDEYVLVANRARKDMIDHLEQLKAQAVEEGRQEAAEAWGRPTVGDREPRRAADLSARRDERQRSLSLADQIKARLAAGRR